MLPPKNDKFGWKVDDLEYEEEKPPKDDDEKTASIFDLTIKHSGAALRNNDRLGERP
jgi:hypothetical protein